MRASRLPNRPLRLVAAALFSLVALWAPTAVSASCLAPVPGVVPWADAESVFVGTVTGVENGDRWATVRVDEVWKGPDQPSEVVVQGGPADAVTSVDRTYAVGTQYVFGVTIENGVLLDNACSGTTPVDTIDLAAMRPADIRQPAGGAPATVGEGSGLGGVTVPLMVMAAVGGILLATVLLNRRRAA